MIASKNSSSRNRFEVALGEAGSVRFWRLLLHTLVFTSIFITLTTVGCGPELRPLPRYEPTEKTSGDRDPLVDRYDVVRAPWETSTPGDFQNESIARGDAAVLRGELDEAMRAYGAALADPDAAVRDGAFTRQMGTLLKLGRSREVLNEVSRYTAREHRKIEDLSGPLALIVAFAYEHARDIDQTLAWLSTAYRASGGDVGTAVPVSKESRKEAQRLIRQVRDDSFESYSQRWGADTFITSVFALERARRKEQPGRSAEPPRPDFFNPDTYRPGALQPVANAETLPMPDASSLPVANAGRVVGVLLPLTGQYAAHGLKVQQGIELAVEQFAPDGQTKFIYSDTGGEVDRAVTEYQRLAQTEGAAIVLGPLLVKDTEGVAHRSVDLKVPFLTYTKRPGITGLSPFALRLGATAEDQVHELVAFATAERSLKRFGFVSLRGTNGDDFQKVFGSVVRNNGGVLAVTLRISPDDDAEIQKAISELEAKQVDGVFIPDAPDKIVGFLKAFRESSLREKSLLGAASWGDPVIIRGYGPLLQGAIFVTPFFALGGRPEVVQFVESFRARFSAEPDLLSAQGFDSARFALSLFQKSDDITNGGPPVIRPEFWKEGMALQGVTGELRSQSNGEIARRMSVLEINDGRAIEIMSAGVPTGAVVDQGPGSHSRNEN